MTNIAETKIVFFGGEPLAVPVLEELKADGMLPSLIVCNPDRPQGRKMALTPPRVKEWALEHNIPVFQPETLKDQESLKPLLEEAYDLFVVVAYAKIIPRVVLDIPKHGTINLHPSLLPKYRGPSPIRSAVLADDRDSIGATIIELDEKIDHGPIIKQMNMEIADEHWPIRGSELDLALARMGGALLSSIIPDWVAGHITPEEQDHDAATFCHFFDKKNGEIDLSADPYQNLLKIRAFDGNPGTFFFAEKDKKQVRVKIVDAEMGDDGSLKITRIIPEGKKEMDYSDF